MKKLLLILSLLAIKETSAHTLLKEGLAHAGIFLASTALYVINTHKRQKLLAMQNQQTFLLDCLCQPKATPPKTNQTDDDRYCLGQLIIRPENQG